MMAAVMPTMLWLMTRIAPVVFFPVAVAGPVVLMLLIGHFVLKERLDAMGWLAGALGVAGLVLLTATS